MAVTCVEKLDLEVPCVVDELGKSIKIQPDNAESWYAVDDIRSYVIDREGVIRHAGARDSREFDPATIEKALKELLKD
jgi:hypothetical protein